MKKSIRLRWLPVEWKKIKRHSILLISRKSVHSYLSIGDNHCNRCANKTLLIPRLFAKIVCTARYAIFISLVKFIWMSRNAFFFVAIIQELSSLYPNTFSFLFKRSSHRSFKIRLMFSSLIS